MVDRQSVIELNIERYDILISGIPKTGKTAFGDWLREHRAFLHVDMESEKFVQAWDADYQRDLTRLLSDLRQKSKNLFSRSLPLNPGKSEDSRSPIGVR